MPYTGKKESPPRRGGAWKEPRDRSPTMSRLGQLSRLVDLNPDWARVLPVPAISAVFNRGPEGARLRLLDLLVSKWTSQLKDVRRELRKEAGNSTAIQRILRTQLADGTWAVEAPSEPAGAHKQMVLVGLLERLYALAELGAQRGWPQVTLSIRAIVGFQLPDGRFPLLYHHHAAIGSLLISFGLIRNPTVHKAAHWILERQRDDGGWLHPHMAGKGKSPPSCLWTTAEVMAFLARYPTMRIKPKLQTAGEFLLLNALEANTTSLLPDAGAWNVLRTGSRGTQLFQGGTLKVLDSLSRAGFSPAHKTFKKLYRWLLEQQLSNGLFPGIVGRDGSGDTMVTVRVLELVQRVESSRPVELAGHPPTD
ncbi:MAG: prenyltransferase/squalene oxidase repeat-containing protein [Candidatus Neomarinimicrobiota bacterium]